VSKTYPTEVKEAALALVINRGLSSRQVAATTGVAYSTIRRWVNDAESIELATTGEIHLVRELKLQLQEAVTERDVLKRAVIIMAKEMST
tara:strand:+ start:13938 stop:14207 length:270 start_codon:yes stop_codon:yes gene_type:complete